MDENKYSFSTIDEYILQFDPVIREKLESIRLIIKESAPQAKEKISYQMPTFTLFGNLVHFAAYKKHIGFYPTPSGVTTYKDELARYKFAKGSIQFPNNEPLPLDLIRKIVESRVIENTKLADMKQTNKPISK